MGVYKCNGSLKMVVILHSGIPRVLPDIPNNVRTNADRCSTVMFI